MTFKGYSTLAEGAYTKNILNVQAARTDALMRNSCTHTDTHTRTETCAQSHTLTNLRETCPMLLQYLSGPCQKPLGFSRTPGGPFKTSCDPPPDLSGSKFNAHSENGKQPNSKQHVAKVCFPLSPKSRASVFATFAPSSTPNSSQWKERGRRMGGSPFESYAFRLKMFDEACSRVGTSGQRRNQQVTSKAALPLASH